jgi:general secretion pathway protein G
MKIRTSPAHRRAGFSLAELMVVIVILGLIATIVVPNLMDRFGYAQRKKAKIDITVLDQAVTTYMTENDGRYPDSLEILVTPDEHNKTYLRGYKSVPLDPWKHPYQYEPPSSGQDFRVYSFGKDGQPGGDGDDADITNSQDGEEDK